MACAPVYLGLACHLSGVGFTARQASLGSAFIYLQEGHGAQFPAVSPGEFFYAEVTDGCHSCCEVVRVVGREDDVLVIERDAPSCDCFSANSRISYLSTTKEAILAIAAEVPFEVVEPLVWDCDTRTLSLDCARLQQMIFGPCGDDPGGGGGGGVDCSDATSTMPTSENSSLPTRMVGSRSAILGAPAGYLQLCPNRMVPFYSE